MIWYGAFDVCTLTWYDVCGGRYLFVGSER